MTKRKAGDPWHNDSVQFPRLLAEIAAVGLTDSQAKLVRKSMDLTRDEFDSLFARAKEAFRRVQLGMLP